RSPNVDRLLRPVRQRGAAFSRTTPPLGKYCFSAVKAVTAVQRTEILGCGTVLHGRRRPAGALWLRYGLRSFTGGFDLRWPRHIRQRYLERYVVAYTVRPETREPIAIFPGGRKCLVSRKGTPKLPTARARPHHA